jgi:putative flavoprotein involved in K+ transport
LNLKYNTIIIGAGQYGVSLSNKLKALNIDHIVLERGSVGNTWITQRWDSFKLVTPKKMNTIENNDNYFLNHDEYITAHDFQEYLSHKYKERDLPIYENHNVTSIEKKRNEIFEVKVNNKGFERSFFSENIVIASGFLNKKMIPNISVKIPEEIKQLHSSEYKSLKDLRKGNTIVVGSGQSGFQIAKEIATKRNVTLLTSKVGSIPRTYMNENIEDWFIKCGLYEVPRSQATQEQLKEVNPFIIEEFDISKSRNIWKNIELAGSLKNIEDGTLVLNDDLVSNLSFQREYYYETIKDINTNSGTKSDTEIDFPQIPFQKSNANFIELQKNRIENIIWATGFRPHFPFLKMDIYNSSEIINQKDGISDVKGLYFLGMPWMRKKKSSIIYGAEEDSRFISEEISRNN